MFTLLGSNFDPWMFVAAGAIATLIVYVINVIGRN
jgi:hypothetical protein